MNPGESPVQGAIARRLNALLAEFRQPEMSPEIAAQFETYFHLLLRWNSRTNLTAIRDEDGVLRRHFLESIACARALPEGISALLDFGSGAGFPGIPIALCRREIAVTLAESQGKKASFLREAVRTLGIQATVHAGRAETLIQAFDCVALRAVDRMDGAIRSASRLVAPSGWIAPLTTVSEASHLQAIAGPEFDWELAISLPGSEDRILLLARRRG